MANKAIRTYKLIFTDDEKIIESKKDKLTKHLFYVGLTYSKYLLAKDEDDAIKKLRETIEEETLDEFYNLNTEAALIEEADQMKLNIEFCANCGEELHENKATGMLECLGCNSKS